MSKGGKQINKQTKIRAKAVNKKKYNQQNMIDALKEMEKGMSSRQAADIFQVPRSTLYAKQKQIIPIESIRGPNIYLTTNEEKLLVN